MADQKVKLEPPAPIVFIGPFDQKRQVIHQLTNISANKITTKVKCSDTAALQASPVYSCVDPGQTIPMTFQCRFADGKPNPKKQYMIGIVIADAPADLPKELPKIKDAWGSIKDFVTMTLQCQFKQPGEEAPAAAAAAPLAEGAPPSECPLADAAAGGEAPAEEAPPAERSNG